MGIVLLVLANASSKSTPNEGAAVKLKDAWRRFVRLWETPQQSAHCSECEQRADESLHQLANRLHVVEFETDVELYGTDIARKRRKPH